MYRLQSRKLWLTIIGGAIVTLGQEFGVDLDPEQIITLGGIVAAYVTGQAIVDKQKVQAEVEAQVERLKSEANSIISALVAKAEEVSTPAYAAPDANTELAPS
jgi:flagellar motor component MotA